MEIELIIEIAKIAGPALVTAIGLTTALITQIKAKRKARTIAEKDEATAAMKTKMCELIELAETTYKDVNKILKQQGQSAGSLKKDSVLVKLQSYAMEKGYEFNEQEWSENIDNMVELTKKVNSNK